MPSTIQWSGGTHTFRLNAAAVHEDTLRIAASDRKQEKIYKLILPTLCITYADMKFQNAVGGEQEKYPASGAYGPRFFNPPVILSGESEVERLTYIRGARKVTIGPRETVVEFPSWKELVIPRLRMDRKKPLQGQVVIPPATISVSEPLRIDIRQFADGRHVGGVRAEKRHPDWRPPQEKQTYDFWVHTFDGITGRSLPKTRVDLFRYDPSFSTPYGQGGFRLDVSRYTDRYGNLKVPGRPAGQVEAYLAKAPGYRAVARCARPLPGQLVRIHIRLWPLSRDLRPYVWRGEDTVPSLSRLCGCTEQEFLDTNHLAPGAPISPGSRMILPCWSAVYRLEPWDRLEWVARNFGCKNVKELARLTRLEPSALEGGAVDIRVPGWHFVYAREGDTLDALDRQFELPKGSAVIVGRCYRPWPRLPYPGEAVALPKGRRTA